MSSNHYISPDLHSNSSMTQSQGLPAHLMPSAFINQQENPNYQQQQQLHSPQQQQPPPQQQRIPSASGAPQQPYPMSNKQPPYPVSDPRNQGYAVQKLPNTPPNMTVKSLDPYAHQQPQQQPQQSGNYQQNYNPSIQTKYNGGYPNSYAQQPPQPQHAQHTQHAQHAQQPYPRHGSLPTQRTTRQGSSPGQHIHPPPARHASLPDQPVHPIHPGHGGHPNQQHYPLQQQQQTPHYMSHHSLPPQQQQQYPPNMQPQMQPQVPQIQPQMQPPQLYSHNQQPYSPIEQEDLTGLDQPCLQQKNKSASSLTANASPGRRIISNVSVASTDVYPQLNAPYPIDGPSQFQTQNIQYPSPPLPPQQQQQQQQQSPTQQQRRSHRKAPGNLPPIQTNQIYNDSFGRRTVSTPGGGTNTQQPYPPRQYDQPQQIQNTTHRHSSSSSGSNSSISRNYSLNKSRSFSSITKLSSLSGKKSASSTTISNQKLEKHQSASSAKTLVPTSQISGPTVYPALLSEVAKIFKEQMPRDTRFTKDGLDYYGAFTGNMAVDIICRIIRTNDRNLALLLGRSLDAQKFFHDVSYDHRLRDSANELYEFSHVYNSADYFQEENGGTSSNGNNSEGNSKHGSFVDSSLYQQIMSVAEESQASPEKPKELTSSQETGVNGVFTILTDCYSPTCTRNHLCYSIACPRRLEQQARLNLKPQGGLKRAVSRLSLHDQEESETLWHKTVPQSVLDKLDKMEKTRQELIYEFVYTERDYVKDLEFMEDFYIRKLSVLPVISDNQREAFLRTVFGGVHELLTLARSFSDALTRRQQQQKPVVETIADVFLDYVGKFDPFVIYSGNKVFATFEHERQQQVNPRYAAFLDKVERQAESRRQDLSSFLIKGVQRPARYQLLLAGILKNTKPDSPDYKDLIKAKEEIEKVLAKINIQTGISTDRHKVMVLHRLLGRQTLENRFNFRLKYSDRIIYQATLSRKRDNEKIDLYIFEHALLLVKHKIQNKREQHKVLERPFLLPLLFVNSGYEIPTTRTIMNSRYHGSILSDISIKNQRAETNYIGNTLNSSSNAKFQINFFALGSNPVHISLFAEDAAIQNQILQQVNQQQKKLIDNSDLFSLTKYETRKFQGNNRINCAVPCYGGKKLLYGTDSGVWVSTVRSISATSNEKICSDPTMVISKVYVSQIEVLVEYSKLLVLTDKSLYEFDLNCTDSLDHIKNTKSGKLLMTHISFFKIGICDGRLIVCGAKTGGQHSICIFEPSSPHDKNKNRNKKLEVQEINFTSDPISISFLKSKLCIGCAKGFEIVTPDGKTKESILDEADPSLDFATQRETVTPLAIYRVGKDFLLCYSEFAFLINRNGWRTTHDWEIFWQGNPQNIALFFPHILAFESGFIEIRDLTSQTLLRALTGENIRFLHSNEHEAMFACEENGYDIIISIDFLNLKPKSPK